jgi:membrane dipeptidase
MERDTSLKDFARMRFFDAHCDAVINALDGDFDFVEGDRQGHLDLPRLREAAVGVQIFAVFTSLGYRPDPDKDLSAYAERAIETIHGWAKASGGRLRIALTTADIRKAASTAPLEAFAPVYGLIGLEGADPLGDRADNLLHFFQAGVRDLIPAWDDNAFSGTAFGSGSSLTPEGFRLIELAEELGVMVDVSHLSDAAFQQVCSVARRPFIASHSNCRAVSPHRRNLTDDMIRATADRGGVMGINLAPSFLDPEYMAAWDAVMAPVAAAGMVAQREFEKVVAGRLEAIPLPAPEWIARHVQHAIRVGGEDCVGMGGDLDGIRALPSGMAGVESYSLIPDLLARAGLTWRQVEKVCWGNLARVFADVLPGGDE